MSSVERNLRLAASDLGSLDSAFAWVVQQYDREFAGASMVNISIEQIMRSGDGSAWEYVWTASIGGLLEEPQR